MITLLLMCQKFLLVYFLYCIFLWTECMLIRWPKGENLLKKYISRLCSRLPLLVFVFWFFFSFSNTVIVLTCFFPKIVCMWTVVLWCMCGQRTTCGSWFYSFTMYIPGTELRSSGFVASTFYPLSHLNDPIVAW